MFEVHIASFSIGIVLGFVLGYLLKPIRYNA
jgi:hypothetical protein